MKQKVIVHHANLENPQRCFVRLYKLYVTHCPPNHPKDAFYLQPLLGSQISHQLLSCCQTFKIIHNLDCLNFNDYLCFNQSSTRSHSLTLRCTRSRINSFRYFFFVNIPFLWNTISYDIVNSTSYAAFKYLD